MNLSFVKRAGLAALLVAIVGLAAATPSEARPSRPRARGFQLFAGPLVGFEVNRVYCGIRAIGETCVDITGSPVLGGGSWPRGSGDAYVFNSGLQIAGIIPTTAVFGGAGTSWAGDTVGSWFMDPSGQQQSGEQITDIYSSLDATDAANWPTAGFYKDTSLFNAALINRQNIAQQDLWWRYWDGNPDQSTNRGHPAGILVEQRGLGWNFPSGNEDLLYFIYRFINITADGSTAAGRAKYDNLVNYGYSTSEIDDIAAVGTRFQQLNEARFNITIPDTGYSITSVYAAIMMDADIGDFLTNFATANLPFSMGLAYVGDWHEGAWSYPSNIFAPPFAVAPGFVGIKYLKSPLNPNTPNPTDEFGITMYSNTTNGAPFPDANGIEQLYRYLSGTVSAALGDNSCTVTNPQQRRLCALVQTQADARFFQSSGPFQMDPGSSSVIVVSYVFAAAVASAVTPFIRSAPPGMVPGTPFSGDRLAAGVPGDTIRNVDRAMGWVSHSDIDADGNIEQNEVVVVERSLLGKGLVAQAVFDNRFLLPFAPEAPSFFAVPGDNQVTIVWQPSVSEQGGDPYYNIASAATLPPAQGGGPNPLYDANYRGAALGTGTNATGDIEGYRVWRGRTPSQMSVIAQFDYATTRFVDRSGTVYNANYGTQCAPELGLTTSCPTFPNSVPIAELTGVQPGLVQIPPGGRVETQTAGATGGNVIITEADTAVSGGVKCGTAACPGLTDTGVPFSYVDSDVLSGVRYYYAVTAFDVNSVKSVGKGNTSLESPLVTRTVTPVAPSGQAVTGVLGTMELLGADGNPLTIGALPSIDATTGIFSGPMPPTDWFSVGFVSFLPELLGSGDVTVTIDSIIPGIALDAANGGFGSQSPSIYYFTGQGAGAPIKFSVGLQIGPGGGSTQLSNASVPFPATAISSAQSAPYGGDSTYQLYGNASIAAPGPWRLTMKGRGDANGNPAGPNNGWRWWTGAANENTNDPNGVTCSVVAFSCALADLSRNVGAMAGVDLFGIQSYFTIASTAPARGIEGVTSGVMRAADFKVYWGTGGAIDSVIDVTHRVPVPFSTAIRASWGILNDSSFLGITTAATTRDANNNLLTWSDFACVAPIPAYSGQCGGAAQVPARLMNRARLSPVAFTSSTYAGTAALATNGNGFIFYLNGTFTLMRMAALPAAGTVWNARFYAGNISGRAGSYAFVAARRPPPVPGLRARISYTGSTLDPSTTADSNLARVHTVPDPYYVTNSLEITSTTKVLRFVNLPSQAIVRIYSVSGVLVNIVSHNDPTGGGEASWNLRNRNNQFVASGVYFYHVETPDGREKIGRFTVVNYAQ